MSASAQNAKLSWANAMHGNSYDVCQAVTVDDAGNVYATGYYSTTVDFDPGPGVFNLTSLNAEDIFLTKYDTDGKLVWAKTIGDFRYQAGYAITLDSAKNIYITGIFFGSLDFDPGPGVTTLTSAGNEDIFISKFDNNGNFVWAKRIGGPTNDFCNAIILDRSGNIYINGYFDDTADFDTGTGFYNMTSNGGTDIFICKLRNDGSFLWAKQIGGILSDAAYSIGLDEQNNVYTTGFFFDVADFDPGPGTFMMNAVGFGDGYILKLSSSGSFITAGKLGGSSRVRCISLKLDNTSHIYIAGSFDGLADFDIGPGSSVLSTAIDDEDVFIAKYDLNLNLVWVKQVGGPSFQKVFAVDTDETGNVYTTGHYSGQVDFDPGSGTYNLTAVADPDIFVLKLTGAGEFTWVYEATGPFYGSGYTLKVDRSDNIYVAGTFEGTIDFDNGPDDHKLTSAGQSEIFMQKLKQCPNTAINTTLNVVTCTAYTLNNKTYDSSGSYINLVLDQTGCDSIIINLNLIITRAITNLPAAICQGQNYYAGGKLQTKAGIYYDTLKTANDCDSVLITTLTVNPIPKPELGADRNICAGETIVLNPGVFSSYLWQDQSTTQVYAVTAPGTYRVKVTNQFNCAATARVIIRNLVNPPANFLPADKQLCSGNVLKISVPGYKSYEWNTGATISTIQIRNHGVYYLEVKDHNNCTGTDSLVVHEINCIPVGIPNAFTPNNDGKNDIFRPVLNVEITDYQLQVFNRNGQLIFQSKNQEEGWDGKFNGQPLDPGTYVYLIRFRNASQKLSTYTGNISLIR